MVGHRACSNTPRLGDFGANSGKPCVSELLKAFDGLPVCVLTLPEIFSWKLLSVTNLSLKARFNCLALLSKANWVSITVLYRHCRSNVKGQQAELSGNGRLRCRLLVFSLSRSTSLPKMQRRERPLPCNGELAPEYGRSRLATKDGPVRNDYLRLIVDV